MTQEQLPKIDIVGGGISGLSLAYFLSKNNFDITLFEKDDMLGGAIQTIENENGIAEWGASGWLNSPFMESFTEELSIPVHGANIENKKKLIFRNKITKWPLDIIETFSFIGNLFIKNHLSKKKLAPLEGESIEDWGNRCVGKPASFYLLQTALQGVYVGKGSNLSASFILSRFFNKKKTAKKKKVAQKGTISPIKGMGQLISILEERIKKSGVTVRTNTTYQVSDLDPNRVTIYCTTIPQLCEILPDNQDNLKQKAQQMNYGDLTTVTTFHRHDSDVPRGFGCLFSPDQNMNALGAIFTDGLYHHERKSHAMRWIFKGCTKVEDEYLILDKIREDYKAMIGTNPEILGYDIKSIPNALPMYDFTLENFYNEELFKFEQGVNNLFIHGNFMKGIGLAQIIEKSSNLSDFIKEKYEQ